MRSVHVALIFGIWFSIMGSFRVLAQSQFLPRSQAEVAEQEGAALTDESDVEGPNEQSPTEPTNGPSTDAIYASNPTNADRQSAVWIDSQQTNQIAVAFSTDGGINWTTQTLALPVKVTSVSLQSVTIDLLGRTHVLLTGSGATPQDGGIYIYSTKNDGKTFRAPIRLFANNSNGVASEPVCAVNVIPQHYLQNHVYVAWIVHGRQYSEVLFTRSVDGGHTFWSIPMRLDAGNHNNVANPDIAIGPWDEITVSWDINPKATGSPSRIGRTSDDGNNFKGLEAQ